MKYEITSDKILKKAQQNNNYYFSVCCIAYECLLLILEVQRISNFINLIF